MGRAALPQPRPAPPVTITGGSAEIDLLRRHLPELTGDHVQVEHAYGNRRVTAVNAWGALEVFVGLDGTLWTHTPRGLHQPFLTRERHDILAFAALLADRALSAHQPLTRDIVTASLRTLAGGGHRIDPTTVYITRAAQLESGTRLAAFRTPEGEIGHVTWNDDDYTRLHNTLQLWFRGHLLTLP